MTARIAPSGPRRGVAALACAVTVGVLALGGCGADRATVMDAPDVAQASVAEVTSSTLFPPPDAAVDAPRDGATGADLRAAVPGLYVPDELDVRPLPSGAVSVHRAGPCSGLRDILLAGDWTLAGELVVPAEAVSFLAIAGLSPQILLRQGDDRAFALLSDGTDGCDATIGRAAAGTVSVQAGAISATGPGYAVASSCIDLGGSLTLSAVVGLSDGSVSAMLNMIVDAPADGVSADSPRTVTSGDSGDSFVTTDPAGVLGLFTQLLALSAAGADESGGDGSTGFPPGFDPATLVTLEAAEDQIGTATVAVSDGNISGTIELTGLVTSSDDGGGAPARIAFPFDCPTVVEFAG